MPSCVVLRSFSTTRTPLAASAAARATLAKMVQPVPTERAAELRDNYDSIANQVKAAAEKRGAGPTVSSPSYSAADSNQVDGQGPHPQPRLVAVSKYKPAGDLLALHEHGVRHFGENYPQELEAKAKELPRDIAWHYIGTLQSNKCKMLASIPNLFAIETLTSVKAANQLHNTLSALSLPRETRLNVFLQVNTSGEEQKSGLPALSRSSSSSADGPLVDLAVHILQKCPTLRLKGLMTIGSLEASTSDAPNPDFERLKETREALVAALRAQTGGAEQDDALRKAVDEGEEEELELSMGMSSDFVEAIEQGSTNVRVGSSIFGARPAKW
ncbi:cytoplasmic protein [Rhodotorula diobovata]|uniref:Pyridoxal phosphate homeostasis protein n=1 Tax=Rhodotorula diobovata TaxID=5288 RepID=A0A5C5G485_9BASI|nr:cytoplasmic protein [Rhodotorula diobovata]